MIRKEKTVGRATVRVGGRTHISFQSHLCPRIFFVQVQVFEVLRSADWLYVYVFRKGRRTERRPDPPGPVECVARTLRNQLDLAGNSPRTRRVRKRVYAISKLFSRPRPASLRHVRRMEVKTVFRTANGDPIRALLN